MNSIKKFINSLIVLGLFLIFIPTLCNADMSLGFFAFPPLIFLFVFFGVWAIESLVIKDRVEESPKRALLLSLAINVASTLLGAFLGYLVFQFKFDISFLAIILILFLGTVIVEGAMLFGIYDKEGWKKIFSTAFLMNFFSYLFLVVSVPIVTAVQVISTVFGFLIIVYLLWRIFGLFQTTKELPSGEKISVRPGAGIFYLILFFLIILLVFGLHIDTRPSPTRKKARDAAFKGTAYSLISKAMMCCDTPGADFVIPPVNDGLVCNIPSTSSEISSEVWPDNTQIDNISITTHCQSDGSFKLRVEPGSGNTGNCDAADCTQKGCTFTGC